MAHTVSASKVNLSLGVTNVDGSGNHGSKGTFVARLIDITSYTAPEAIPASALGLEKVYGAVVLNEETDTYAARRADASSDQKTLNLYFDTAGSGTAVSGTTDIGVVCVLAWGEKIGTQDNA